MRLRPAGRPRSYPQHVDLSGIIFVVLAVGWAGYLIPKALRHHDDQARTRPVDTFSDSVRVVGASTRRTASRTSSSVDHGVATTETDVVEVVAVDVEMTHLDEPRQAHTITRDAARRAARRRRRVLLVLLVALVASVATSYLSYTPWWSAVIPAVLVVAFLVTARLTVRAQQVRRAAPDQRSGSPAEAVEPVVPSRATAPAEVEPDLDREDTSGLSRDELAEAVAVPVLDEGGLWDPLPVTLPTYVNKARARRTVRTIEITGITSSGHDAADTELARSVEEAAAEVETDEAAEERRAAGA